ncbi:MAG: acyl-CoA dehydrogenase, partial [Chitinivibrionales bacterium]|nr:acyl-CoA dehydrogenase [Chitinivibrionales bacterium]
MEFDFSSEQKAFKKEAREFAERVSRGDILERDKECTFSRELWDEYAKFGAMGITVPEEYGGLGLDLLTGVAIMEGFGAGADDHGLLFSINAHIWSCVQPILTFGTAEQKDRYLRGLCEGKLIGVHAMTEPSSGSDAFSLKATAERDDGDYVLNGSKTFITNGNLADLVLVFAKTKNARGGEGISCIVVEKGTPGFTPSKNIEKMGLRTSPFCQLFFNDCRVPAHNRIGEEGMGRVIFSHAMDEERTLILATQIGVMERQLSECLRYSKQRVQFGQKIFKFQSISNILAEMKVRLETSRLLLYKVAWKKMLGKNATQESAMAKLYISECGVKNGMDAMRIYGAYGYSSEYGLERRLRDSIGGLFYSGTSGMM